MSRACNLETLESEPALRHLSTLVAAILASECGLESGGVIGEYEAKELFSVTLQVETCSVSGFILL